MLGSNLFVRGLAADEPAGMPPAAKDVALGPNGLLSGHVTNANGAPAANVTVSLQDFQNQPIANVVTDPNGNFAIDGIRGGMYQLVTPDGRTIYRLWAPGTAPPSAPQAQRLR